MLRGPRPLAVGASTPPPEPRPAGRALGPIVGAGLVVGALTGLVGVGGGFLIVPALVLLLGLPMKQAVGTSLLVIAMNAATGFLGYAGQVAIDWGAAGAFGAAAAAGIVVGSALTRSVSAHALRRAFAFFLVGMGVFILYQNRLALLPS
jgi:uncharacterized membrane protein YfcA